MKLSESKIDRKVTKSRAYFTFYPDLRLTALAGLKFGINHPIFYFFLDCISFDFYKFINLIGFMLL